MSLPLIIAHRGASAYAPENTMASFILAYDLHADMIELDVQCSADGNLVVFHDETTVRWNGASRPICSCSLSELRDLNINGEKIPTLAEICAFSRKSGIALNIELKQPHLGARSAALLHEYGITERVLISSFYECALSEFQKLEPAIPRGYLMGIRTFAPRVRLRELWPFRALRSVHAAAWHPAYELPLLSRLIPLVRRAGYAVNVWTVDDPLMMSRVVAYGASGIITNRPDVARHRLGL